MSNPVPPSPPVRRTPRAPVVDPAPKKVTKADVMELIESVMKDGKIDAKERAFIANYKTRNADRFEDAETRTMLDFIKPPPVAGAPPTGTGGSAVEAIANAFKAAAADGKIDGKDIADIVKAAMSNDGRLRNDERAQITKLVNGSKDKMTPDGTEAYQADVVRTGPAHLKALANKLAADGTIDAQDVAHLLRDAWRVDSKLTPDELAALAEIMGTHGSKFTPEAKKLFESYAPSTPVVAHEEPITPTYEPPQPLPTR